MRSSTKRPRCPDAGRDCVLDMPQKRRSRLRPQPGVVTQKGRPDHMVQEQSTDRLADPARRPIGEHDLFEGGTWFIMHSRGRGPGNSSGCPPSRHGSLPTSGSEPHCGPKMRPAGTRRATSRAALGYDIPGAGRDRRRRIPRLDQGRSGHGLPYVVEYGPPPSGTACGVPKNVRYSLDESVSIPARSVWPIPRRANQLGSGFVVCGRIG